MQNPRKLALTKQNFEQIIDMEEVPGGIRSWSERFLKIWTKIL